MLKVKGSRCYIVSLILRQVSENDIYENILLPSKSENIKYLNRSEEEDFENYNMKVEADGKDITFYRLHRRRDSETCTLALFPRKSNSPKKSYYRTLAPGIRDFFEVCNTKAITTSYYEYSCCNTDACNHGARYLEPANVKTLTCYYGHNPIKGSDNGFCVSGSSPGYRNNDIVGFRREDFEKCNTKLRYAGDIWKFSCCTTDKCNPLIKAKIEYNI
ncbi:uncharacterized protein LOC128344935 isoform X2 [Hemicordylus capensis]|uniref:uncharacterized protein LOC128344935 isoform X2 n=1 Tax=Hemicordylus capensis TaxID=884348 RepID=UPI00230270BA|nr:uncharacterized protein LOC128344935 isoform X2 [Hemicordylus capensis]